MVAAVVPDEDPARDPTLWFGGERELPNEVMRWVMEHVGNEVERAREAMTNGGEGVS